MSKQEDSLPEFNEIAQFNSERQPVALLTKHDKGGLIAAELAEVGLDVEVTSAFDTDNLGTFSGEVPRSLSPLECAKRKAQLACELTGLNIGLGSEGSFGGGPMPGFVNWDEEILVMYDKQADLEIVAYVQGPIKVGDFTPLSIEQLKNQIKKADKSSAKYAIILAQEEAENKQLTIKPLRERQEQFTIDQSQLLETFNTLIQA